ncbi:MAG: ribbon-helix-helix protein, CopG family [Planctomycetota bacterium]
MVFSIRLSEELVKELDQIAAETERPRSFHVQRAIETYLREFADLQIALDRLRDPGDAVVSGRDIRKSLGI